MKQRYERTSLFEHFSIIQGPRQSWKVEHNLFDILLLTVCAVIAGAEGWEDIEEFGKERLDWLRQYGDFADGIPVHDTIPPLAGRDRTLLMKFERVDRL